MGNNNSKKRARPDKNLRYALDQEVQFSERLASDRKFFSNTSNFSDTLNAKGSFLLAVYAKLSSSAVHLYKISHRIFLLKPTKSGGMKRTVAIETQRELERELARGLAEWGNANSASQWLLHDYDLSFRTVMLNMPEQKGWEDADRYQDVESRKSELDRLVAETKRLKMEALQVGFKYLDRNYSGFLEPSDIPNLPTHVYARLDTNSKHKLSWNDIQKTIDTMETNVYNLRSEITRLADNFSAQQGAFNQTTDPREQSRIDVEMFDTRERYNAAITDANNEERALNQVYELFRQAFTRNVFDAIPYGQHTDALPTLSRAVKESQHTEELPAPKTIEPWMTRIGSDILFPGSHTPIAALATPMSIPPKDKSFLNIPVAHSDATATASPALESVQHAGHSSDEMKTRVAMEQAQPQMTRVETPTHFVQDQLPTLNQSTWQNQQPMSQGGTWQNQQPISQGGTWQNQQPVSQGMVHQPVLQHQQPVNQGFVKTSPANQGENIWQNNNEGIVPSSHNGASAYNTPENRYRRGSASGINNNHSEGTRVPNLENPDNVIVTKSTIQNADGSIPFQREQVITKNADGSVPFQQEHTVKNVNGSVPFQQEQVITKINEPARGNKPAEERTVFERVQNFFEAK